MSQCFILIILFYQRFISILFVSRCRFQPTCSNYALSALYNFNAIKGCYLIITRILKCHPFHPGGLDNIPKNAKK
ncbi:membrane protein insertion efficiency factor YidD [Buchnera aphidicola (Melaphis rhois)]|uniref:Putative membrane protein insertion efficiency factor n=1 Tax=Buchnera aphidicola subsp. Melaphis rhois TaxID=118103 RepID=A0A4D6YGS6_BUCMH|nr:membrane protein insertion efficiency factor YidD [Buchnera aphidicola (Melaphis rhois)]